MPVPAIQDAAQESWASVGAEELGVRLRAQTDCGNQASRRTRVPWEGRSEDKTDDSVWALTCFVTRTGFRRRGISRALARAAVDFARQRGARAIEGYPMIAQAEQEVTWGELHVGVRSIFAAAGFTEVSHPTVRRVVMRIDF